MIVIGIAGGIGSGKSTVARLFERFGAKVLDADRLAREAMESAEIRDQIQHHFGEQVLTPEREFDRKYLAAIVFGDDPNSEARRRTLESILHPWIRERAQRQLLTWRSEQVPIAVLDAPLLFEANWNAWCDIVLFVDAPEETRRRRTESRGWDDQELHRREKTQLPVAVKRARADCVISNSGELQELERQVRDLAQRYGLAN